MNSNDNSTKQDKSNTKSGTRARGFASMDPERQRQIAAEGGRAAHAAGTAHEFTSEEARAAGRHSHDNASKRNAANNPANKPVAATARTDNSNTSSGKHGGQSEQHVAEGRQSHKDNDSQTSSTKR